MQRYKSLKANLFLICMSLFLVSCEVVDLDSAGKPIIPMSAEESSALNNMDPKDIADKIWNDVLQEARQSDISLKQILSNTANEKSYFTMLNGVLENIDERQNLMVRSDDQIITVQFGKIIRGNAIRDASSVISFDQFKNQIQFAKLSKELNKKAMVSIMKLDRTLLGKDINLLIALTIKNKQIQDVVPLEIYAE
ncbi:hypothetical protein A1D23_01380 [Chelonobacter oris]|uniref:DUF2291 family protein n=1 Tax=Chelonobacter oris TaxID=505317 RepID=UPI0024479D23|nr:DUF2291 family protein [Chelonobacter oris]MDH3000511.1 hypothetical protein [Chelonobacter oris]